MEAGKQAEGRGRQGRWRSLDIELLLLQTRQIQDHFDTIFSKAAYRCDVEADECRWRQGQGSRQRAGAGRWRSLDIEFPIEGRWPLFWALTPALDHQTYTLPID